MRCPPPTGKPPQRHHPWAKLTASALAGPQQVANSEESRPRAAPSGTQRPLLLPTRTGRGESRTPSPVGHAAARPPFHPRSTVAVAAGAPDGSQQLHATLTPHTRCHALCRTKATALPAAPTAGLQRKTKMLAGPVICGGRRERASATSRYSAPTTPAAPPSSPSLSRCRGYCRRWAHLRRQKRAGFREMAVVTWGMFSPPISHQRRTEMLCPLPPLRPLKG